MDRKITDEIFIAAKPIYTFNALISPSLIKQWWYVSAAIVIPEVDGIYALTWGDDLDNPDFTTVSRLTEFDYGKHLAMTNEKYYSPSGSIPFDAPLKVRFSLEEKEGGTLLYLLQEGIPMDEVADDFYHATVEGWTHTLKSLKSVVEDDYLSTQNLTMAD